MWKESREDRASGLDSRSIFDDSQENWILTGIVNDNSDQPIPNALVSVQIYDPNYDPNAKAIIISGYEEDVLNGLDRRKKKLIKGFLVKLFGKYELSASLAQLLK